VTAGAFLRSKKNLLGVILGCGGLMVALTGVIPLIAGLPLVVGLYLVGVLIGPAAPAPELKFDVTGNDEEIKESLEQLLRQVQGRVPDDVLLRVQSIRDSILATLGDPNQAPGAAAPSRSSADPNVYLIQQTALQYLPTALNAYLSLPRRYTLNDLPGRKKAHQVLLDSLVLMDEKLSEVTDAILARDAQKLEVYSRFIREKFGSSRLDLDAFEKSLAPAEAPEPAEAPAAVEAQAAVEAAAATERQAATEAQATEPADQERTRA
jgi:hypothetical protein